MFFDILQLTGGIIMSFGQIPQIIQVLRTRSAKDLNLKTYMMMVAGISLMEVYAVNLVLNGAGGAFLITNTFSLIASIIMVILILQYGRRQRRPLGTADASGTVNNDSSVWPADSGKNSRDS